MGELFRNPRFKDEAWERTGTYTQRFRKSSPIVWLVLLTEDSPRNLDESQALAVFPKEMYLSRRASSTSGGTNLLTSPFSDAISRTSDEEM